MDINRATEIISILAEGIDPTTGEVLPDNSVCNKGEIVRALYAVLNHLNWNVSAKNSPDNAGKPWTKEDDDLLINLYHSKASKENICHTLRRTASGIAARLVRLGIIENRDVFRQKN